MEYRPPPHRRKTDPEEVVHLASPKRPQNQEPKAPDCQSRRPPLVGRRQDHVGHPSEKTVEQHADGNEGYSDVPNAADGADHEGKDGDFTSSCRS